MQHYTIDTLDDYLRGELPADRDALIHAHLEACSACSALYDEAAGLREWIHASAAAEEREFPSLIKARVWEAIRTAAPSPLERLRSFWRPAIALPIAAVLAVAAYVSLPIGRNGAPVGVAATYLLEEHAAETSGNPLADRGLIVPASLPAERSARTLLDAADAATLTDVGGSGGR